MDGTSGSVPFRSNAVRALADAPLRASLSHATGLFSQKRSEALASVPIEEWREIASTTRLKVLDDLPDYVDLFAKNATAAGAVVHRAKDAASAREIAGLLLRDRSIKKLVKSKSMVSEEIHMNAYLEKQGLKVIETDLGEYIIQIARETPSHIIVPAIHKNRRQVGKLFSEKLGCEYSEDPTVLTKIARKVLREEFLTADAGMSGANFAVADTGSLVIFTNEGNGRMVTTLPRLHIAVLSIEKIIPLFSDLPKFIRLLPRSATGQTLTTYMSIITGTRKPHESTGAAELHIILLDNGRSKIVRGPCREILKCVRCGACMNVCPVYRLVGGHAYASTYPGPMGIILTALLDGLERANTLLDATTLCGACGEVCPVKVPLPSLLRRLRETRAELGLTPAGERAGMKAFGMAVQSPSLFHMGQAFSRTFWTPARMTMGGVMDRLPRPSDKPFRKRI